MEIVNPSPGDVWEKRTGYAGAGERVLVESVVAGAPARAWVREMPHGDVVSLTLEALSARYKRVSP